MPLYCYICDSCGHKFEDIVKVQYASSPYACVECGRPARRNYQAENKVMFDDIEPYFDWSIGKKITGRRDKAEQYKAGGYEMLYGAHGGESVKADKRFYADEEHKEKFVDRPMTDFDKKYDDAVAEGLEKPPTSEEPDATLIRTA